MASVWYIGQADSRTITAAQWAAAGVAGASDTTWNAANGWSIPTTSFTAAQLTILNADGSFNTAAADGPRPGGGGVIGNDSPLLRRADLTGLGIDPSQLRRKFQAWRPGAANSYVGPELAGDDLPTVSLGQAGDAVTYNRAYTPAGAGVAGIPQVVEAFGKMTILTNNWSAKTSNNGIATVSTYRFMCDGDKISLFTYAGGFAIDLYVNGKPYAGNHILPVATTGFAPYGFQNFVFPSAKPRLIELRMIGGMAGLYTQKPYRIWKPPADSRPKIAVVGDSFVAPTVMSDTAAGGAGNALYLRGIYQRLPMLLGLPHLVTDGIGGTGYVAGAAGNRPYTHAERVQWAQDVNPDVFIVHGGGANDLYNDHPLSTINATINTYFRTLREKLPFAKLVFVEGFAPPLNGFNENNPDYITIRQTAQAALADVGVYYIDVATTEPWITGQPNGWVTANAGDGNSNVYIGSDAVHLSVKGNTYLRHRLASKLLKILADDGTLLNQLI